MDDVGVDEDALPPTTVTNLSSGIASNSCTRLSKPRKKSCAGFTSRIGDNDMDRIVKRVVLTILRESERERTPHVVRDRESQKVSGSTNVKKNGERGEGGIFLFLPSSHLVVRKEAFQFVFRQQNRLRGSIEGVNIHSHLW